MDEYHREARGLSYEEYKKVACPSCGRPNGSGHSDQCPVEKAPECKIRELFELDAENGNF